MGVSGKYYILKICTTYFKYDTLKTYINLMTKWISICDKYSYLILFGTQNL